MKQSKQLLLFAVIFILGGIAMFVIGLIPPPPLLDGESIPYEELSTKNAYYIEDLAVVWEYGSISGGDDSGSYYLAYYQDKDNKLCSVSVYFDNSPEWKAASSHNDYETNDMLMGGCFRASTVSSLSEAMKRYYGDCLTDFRDIGADYLGTSDIRDTGIHLRFVCDDKEGYADAMSTTAHFIGGGVLLAVAGLFFFLSKKVKEKEETTSRIQMTTSQYDPFTGAPMGPQHPYGVPAQPTLTSPDSQSRDNYQGPEF